MPITLAKKEIHIIIQLQIVRIPGCVKNISLKGACLAADNVNTYLLLSRSDSSPHQREDSYYTSSRHLSAQMSHSHSQTPPRSPSPSHVSTSTCSDTGDVDLPDEPAPDIMNWEEYTRTSVNDDGKIEYECLWPDHLQSSGICGFKRKKQGVKRHVEAKHLGIRRHICSYCEKSFSTKLAVNSHTWRKHTGEKPLTCRYECGKRFNDPARQFRHYESAHGYVSRNPRRKNPR
ncbi:hypothetical protein BDQ12DRAFT_184577 [Crucibulum laeve]|uniref:C2H2-type domain-containing protein n=1 Tax=Crucibulum laeve TaxID=68775 RepID=A0A5C3MFX9_9AGAR|nr:hypothetical protein BDQ12DRAFT_184577 [Crucibulum laeve]